MPIIAAASPPAPYMGGKRNLAKRLCTIIDRIPHRAYIEPFVGMGGVFLRRATPAPVEVINDLSGDVANLFRIIRRHYEPLIRELRYLPAGRDEFERQMRLDPDALTDIERAVRFLYVQRLSFGGKVVGRTFGVRREQSSRIQLSQLRAELRLLSRRLEPVTIERLPYQDVIRRYDGRQALFYLDPPYDETTGYGVAFDRGDYQRMADQLGAIAGSFLMSINDTPFIRETFARFHISEVDTTWTVSSATAGRAQRVTELLISNIVI